MDSTDAQTSEPEKPVTSTPEHLETKPLESEVESSIFDSSTIDVKLQEKDFQISELKREAQEVMKMRTQEDAQRRDLERKYETIKQVLHESDKYEQLKSTVSQLSQMMVDKSEGKNDLSHQQ